MNEEYLTVVELGARLKVAPKTVRNRMRNGTWRRGEHWFRPRGSHPRFKWSAIVRWLEELDHNDPPGDGLAYARDIPPAGRGRPRGVDGSPGPDVRNQEV